MDNMDEYVRRKLTEWDLSEYIQKFEEHKITRRSLLKLTNEHIRELIPEIGARVEFEENLRVLKDGPSTSSSRDTNEDKLSKAKEIMKTVQEQLPDSTQLASYVQKQIEALTTDKKQLVGLFGRSGAGKSSLINAIIGKNYLLASKKSAACTSVIVKVEADMDKRDYEAEIEFISKEDWEDEVSMHKLYGADKDEDKGVSEKLSAVYGEAWKHEQTKNLMSKRFLKEIPEFLTSTKKTLRSDSEKGLSEQLRQFTRAGSDDQRYYWPVVKCVTITVPNNALLQHVTLVDLPGSGDCNKSRDKMWKEMIGKCSIVWIVSEMTRVGSEKETWGMLENACSLMGNGGECRQILFICTKSDVLGIPDASSGEDNGREIIETNGKTKDIVKKKLRELPNFKTHFGDNFEVFTVSSKEYMCTKYLSQDETEIPKLQRYLEILNDRHSETLNYISGAYGILSLIEGARTKSGAIYRNVIDQVERNLENELDQAIQTMDKACEALQSCLAAGVADSKKSSEKDLEELFDRHPRNNFFRTLRSVLKNGGCYKPRQKPEINLNATISSRLTKSIDDKFKKIFPNGEKDGQFNTVVGKFSLGTQSPIEKNTEMMLLLSSLKSQEAQVKSKLQGHIREQKKAIYKSLQNSIAETMAKCYQDAAKIKGPGAVTRMVDKTKEKVKTSKGTMFDQAKDEMIKMMNDLKEEVLQIMKNDVMEVIKLSREQSHDSLPDFSTQHSQMQTLKEEVEREQGTDPPGAGASQA